MNYKLTTAHLRTKNPIVLSPMPSRTPRQPLPTWQGRRQRLRDQPLPTPSQFVVVVGWSARTRTAKDHPHSMEIGDTVEHTYKGFTAKAEYAGNDKVVWNGIAACKLSGFCKAHVKYLIAEGKIEEGNIFLNGWTACNLPGKKKGVWV